MNKIAVLKTIDCSLTGPGTYFRLKKKKKGKDITCTPCIHIMAGR